MYVLPVSIVFISVATIVVALRLFTRIRLLNSPGWDDWFLLLALITDYAFFGVLIAEHEYGLGTAERVLSEDTYRNQLKMLWVSVPLYNLTLQLTKISMIILYLRLFPTKVYRRVLMTILVVFVGVTLYMVIGTFLVCVPVHEFWSTQTDHPGCNSRTAVWLVNAGLQITSDFVIVILPMPLLVKLRIPLRQRICLMLIFALGLFVCATSIARLYSLVKLIQTKERDYSKHNGLVAIWSFVEANVALVCASLPTFRQLILHIFPRIFPSSARKNYSRHSEKRLQDPGYTWGPFTGPASYSADVSVSADHDSASPCEDGIQVVRELRWVTGSIASGSENAEPERGEPSRVPTPTIQFE
ncbi:hypothetical protein ASPVEDRAFT_39496 [Aspergillus versicolor CBS 583.65]|uniref:Rhodopsin domain-containing protein n=1 Tax=Aspergillus versicolor CBS 583.65 TaxID=1036611 RepID=A0A1L9PEY3_ASPVE|nr:uncharacterized protein ASPVEDRAFT_39496 [Aspergillus versicolor CBS 583.65]OJJ00107.1 hypothetical protein ASPVEDRAFT_39496 [Aspergillus versicolor CBS 583.65]